MRWQQKTKTKIKPKVEDIRLKLCFALFPVTIKGETRWLEKVTIKQKYYEYLYSDAYNNRKMKGIWKNIEFVN